MSKFLTNTRNLGYIFIGTAIAGLYSALMLTVERIELLKNPAHELGCDLNPIIACGSVMTSSQGEAFSIPNPLIGLAGFGGLLAVGLALTAGAKFARWYWLFIQTGLLFAVVFVHWLIFQTIYRINAVCPYCVVVWISSITAFWYALLYNLQSKNIKTPKKFEKIADFASKHHLDLLIVWFLIIAGLILNHFWYYWSSLI